jgi:hypothetical protein
MSEKRASRISGRSYYTVSIMEFRDGKVWCETQYFAEPFATPVGRETPVPSAQNRKIGSDCSFHASEPLENCSFSPSVTVPAPVSHYRS